MTIFLKFVHQNYVKITRTPYVSGKKANPREKHALIKFELGVGVHQ